MMRIHLGKPQLLGLLGAAIVVVGAFSNVVLPWSVSFGFYALGGALFFVAVVWAWSAGVADATRAWDTARRPLFCPACGQRYPESQGHTCPRDGSELRPVA